jgi:hypothetical protein
MPEMLAGAEANQKSSVARRCRRRGKEAKIERANTNTANIIGGALRRQQRLRGVGAHR